MDENLKILFEQNGSYLKRCQVPSKSAYNHLLQLIAEGVIERVKGGVYHYPTEAFDGTMIDVDKVVSGGVLCLYSAWSYYELSVQIPQAFNIAIEKSRKVTLPLYPPITLYYWKREYQELGVVEREIKSTKIVVTHHVPSFQLLSPEFVGSRANGAFTVELSGYIEQSGVDYWIYGHSHRNIDVTIGKTQCVCRYYL